MKLPSFTVIVQKVDKIGTKIEKTLSHTASRFASPSPAPSSAASSVADEEPSCALSSTTSSLGSEDAESRPVRSLSATSSDLQLGSMLGRRSSAYSTGSAASAGSSRKEMDGSARWRAQVAGASQRSKVRRHTAMAF